MKIANIKKTNKTGQHSNARLAKLGSTLSRMEHVPQQSRQTVAPRERTRPRDERSRKKENNRVAIELFYSQKGKGKISRKPLKERKMVVATIF